MLVADAQSLIAGAVPNHVGVWADCGAGQGTFTRALANLLRSGSRIYAVDRNRSSLAWAGQSASAAGVQIIPVIDDFAREFDVPEGPTGLLDGMLFANSLHFVHNPAAVLARLVGWLRPGGRVVLVEYDQREASQWVPYPISMGSLPALARAAGLTQPRLTGSRPSEYRGILYAAAMDKSA